MTMTAHGTRSTSALLATQLCATLALTFLAAGNALGAWSCSTSVTPLGFGTYDVFSGTPDDSTATLSVTCTQVSTPVGNLPVTASLSQGSSGTFATRQMKSGANSLSYNMYANATRTTVFGDGTAGTSTISGTFPFTAVGQSFTGTGTIYGRIPAGQDVAVGAYTDSIVATVTY
ncbi:MAG: spore coat protein U domain-containing protein [Casimicrobiaceae bacterium]